MVQILVIVGAKVQDVGLPTDAYYAVEDIHNVCTMGVAILC